MKEKKISIIIPLFNAISYMEKCISSILNQTYQNIEIILINDGSTDGTREYCDYYAKVDNRVKVFHQQNRGVSYARNVGLKHATGDFIGFVDSDDYVNNNMYQLMFDRIKKDNSDISICGYYITKNNIDIKKYFLKSMALNSKTALKLLIEDKVVRNFLWSMLYKKELFNDIVFPLNQNYEDVSIIYKLFLKANSISIMEETLYHYVQRENSITSSNTGSSGLILYETLLKQKGEVIKIYPELYKHCLIHEYTYLYQWSLELRKEKNENYLEISNKIKKQTFKDIMSSNNISFMTKTKIISKKNLEFYYYIIYRLKKIIKEKPLFLKIVTKFS